MSLDARLLHKPATLQALSYLTEFGGQMNRLLILTVALLTGVSGLIQAQPANAAGGGESFAISSMGRVAMTVSDGAFDGNTATIPIRLTYEKWDNEDYGDITISILNLRMRQVGAATTNSSMNTWHSWWSGAAQKGWGEAKLTMFGSAFVPNQPVLVYGSAQFSNSRTNETVEVAFQPVLTILVAQEETTLREVKVGPRSISGRATVESTIGTTGAGGTVNVRYREPGSKQWTNVRDFVNCPDDVCLAVDALGNFNMTTIETIPLEARVEISVVDCGWCTDARQTVTRGK